MTALPEKHYHIGLVVPDLDEAAERHTRLYGTQWCSERRLALTVAVDGTPTDIDLRVRYSLGAEPHVELIQDMTGVVWGAGAFGLNHVGYYVKDIAAAVAQLEAEGMPCRIHDTSGPEGGPRVFAYHEDPSGLWVELVHTSFRDNLAAWAESTLAGSTDPGGILKDEQP